MIPNSQLISLIIDPFRLDEVAFFIELIEFSQVFMWLIPDKKQVLCRLQNPVGTRGVDGIGRDGPDTKAGTKVCNL